MSEFSGRGQSRLEPAPAWVVLTEAPLKGLALAREAGTILAWDERHQLYLFDLQGQHRSVSRAPGNLISAAISDDGSLIALLGEGNRLWLLDADLGSIADRQAPPEASCLAIDPHGRYVAVGSRLSLTQFFNRHGKNAGRFETRQALAHLVFVPDRPFLIGAATYGMLVGLELSPANAEGRLEAEVAWQEALMSNVGRLTATGDGGTILASCFTHGVQRYDLSGRNEGAYHLGGTASHAVPDFAGRLFAVSTLEGDLTILNPAGNIRWKTTLPRPAIGLETDPLGRFIIHGQGTGEITKLDLYASERASSAPGGGGVEAHIVPKAGGASVRAADWMIPVASSDDQAETSVLAVLDEPARIGLMTNTSRLQIFAPEGKNLGQAPDILGIGRILRTSDGWIAAATDKNLVIYDARRNTAQRVDLSLVEITHLAIRPESVGIAIVQERDRIGRATVAGRWVWKRELTSPVEEIAVGPEGYIAATTNDGLLTVFNPAGEPSSLEIGDPSDPACLIDAPVPSPGNVTWISMSRRAQLLRGHDRLGKVVWQLPISFEGWQLQRLGPIALVSAPDGRALAIDGSGQVRGQGRGTEGGTDVFSVSASGEPLRISRQGVHLICSDLAGKVKWRAVAEGGLGPIAAGKAGVAVMIGRSLAWFGAS
ncbi:hypothetical protein [Singulisphaera sp. PoT]|uniref:hypothetical protein n=1 Tax=Singulisphaera sp. PoT TaxID=3411797 RepID=UPI003BF4D2E9